MRDLNPDIKHPNVMEREFAVVTTEYIKLTFYYVGCMATARSRSIVTSLNFFPMIRINIKNVHIVHPMDTVISSKIVNL